MKSKKKKQKKKPHNKTPIKYTEKIDIIAEFEQLDKNCKKYDAEMKEILTPKGIWKYLPHISM